MPSVGNSSVMEEFCEKGFLISMVRELSRVLSRRTHGQETIWNKIPSEWNEVEAGKWKNPTAAPKDSKETLRKKLDFLRKNINSEKLSDDQKDKLSLYSKGEINILLQRMKFEKDLKNISEVDTHLSHCEGEVIGSENLQMLEKLKDQCENIHKKIESIKKHQTLMSPKTDLGLSMRKVNKRKSAEISNPVCQSSKKKYPKVLLKPILPKSNMTCSDNVVSEVPPMPVTIYTVLCHPLEHIDLRAASTVSPSESTVNLCDKLHSDIQSNTKNSTSFSFDYLNENIHDTSPGYKSSSVGNSSHIQDHDHNLCHKDITSTWEKNKKKDHIETRPSTPDATDDGNFDCNTLEAQTSVSSFHSCESFDSGVDTDNGELIGFGQDVDVEDWFESFDLENIMKNPEECFDNFDNFPG